MRGGEFEEGFFSLDGNLISLMVFDKCEQRLYTSLFFFKVLISVLNSVSHVLLYVFLLLITFARCFLIFIIKGYFSKK